MSKNNNILSPYLSMTIVCCTIIMLIFFSSCSANKKQLANAIRNRDSLPVMRTLGVSTLVSDSGITRYRVNTKQWLIYDRKNPPYWAFEKGVYLEKFDSLYHVEASIKADTAYYFDREKLWRLKGHVVIKSLKGEKFETTELFWNQQTQKVYSDKYIRIQQQDKIITGYGFESNQQLTQYTIHNSGGIFPVKDEPIQKPDSVK